MADEQEGFGEPWRMNKGMDAIYDSKDGRGNLVYAMVSRGLGDAPIDALKVERIVACVNFLAGIPTAELERLIALRADEKLREDIRAAYRASRWCDSGDGT
ncbi:MAG TPA: hypothetical protein VNH18_06480 [Bryobacteraceae bacterium]|nr:hypothetical protein [Bryobacteraceae bacterium]